MNDKFWARLETTDWASLGNADVPKWIRNLVSEDRKPHVQGFGPLKDLIAKSETGAPENYASIKELLKTEIPIYMTPIFIELLQDETTARKDSVLELISDLACYPDIVKPSDDDIYKDRVKRVFEAVLKGMDTYKMLLDDADIKVRKMAKEVLGEIEDSQ